MDRFLRIASPDIILDSLVQPRVPGHLRYRAAHPHLPRQRLRGRVARYHREQLRCHSGCPIFNDLGIRIRSNGRDDCDAV